MQIIVPAKIESIPLAVDFLRDNLASCKKLTSKNLSLTVMYIEDIIVDVIDKANDNSNITISLVNFLGEFKVKIAYWGKEVNPSAQGYNSGYNIDISSSDIGSDEMLLAIKNIIQKASEDKLECRYSRGRGSIIVTAYSSRYRQFYLVITAILLGILAGVLCRFIPSGVSDFLVNDVFKSCYTTFINLIEMVVGPVILFSIASSVAGFGDIRAVGKVGIKVFLCYCATSIIAILVGLCVFVSRPIGSPVLASAVRTVDESITDGASSFSLSIRDMLMSIVPTNIIDALLRTDILQIIFLALLLGIACTKVGKNRERVQSTLETLNELFLKMIDIIVCFIPIITFCSMASLIATTGATTLISLFGWIAMIYVADILMNVIYIALVAIFARINPIIYLKKLLPFMVSAYTLGTTNATLPVAMELADKELGIDKKLFSFALPLGSTINMDANCINFVITTLFMARVFSINLSPNMLVSLFITILLLSIGCPAIPGANFVCLAILLPQAGIPVNAISLIIGFGAIIGSIQVMTNSTSDISMTTIVAASEKLINKDILYK